MAHAHRRAPSGTMSWTAKVLVRGRRSAMSISPILDSVDGWLAEHAPRTRRALAPPAAETDLAGAERELGVILSPTVRQLLAWHNGSADPSAPFDLAPGFEFLGVEDIVDAAKRRGRSVDPGSAAWDRAWVPVASDGCGAHLVVDHGAEPGRVLLSDPEDGPHFRETWPSLADLLARTYEAMRDGTPLLHGRCFVENGRLRWDEAD
jgi:cell wall assembly regulator SMI1